MTHEHMHLWFSCVQGDAECEARQEACEAEAACLEGDNECIAAARGTLWSPMTVSLVLSLTVSRRNLWILCVSVEQPTHGWKCG